MTRKERRQKLKKYASRYSPKYLRKRVAKHMFEHNKAYAKAKGVRHINFSLTPKKWLRLWIKMNPVRARELFKPHQIHEAMTMR